MVLLLLAKAALANGAYQRTEDRKKALVWNNDPKPQDAASWSGERDGKGYATGHGTLTWFRVDRVPVTGSNISIARKKTPISAYTGNMVRGKFEGPVETVDHRKAYHAKFVDGRRKGLWIQGPPVAKTESAETSTEKTRHAESAASPEVATGSTTAKEKAAPESAEPQTTSDISAAGPVDQKAEVSAQKTEISESAATKPSEPSTLKTEPSSPMIAQASTDESEASATPREPVTRKAALAPGAVRAIERPTAGATKRTEVAAKRTARAKATAEMTEKPSKPAKSGSSEPAELDTNVSEQSPAEGPPAEKEETPPDDSIFSLTGPPKSLRQTTAAETNPPSQISTPATVAASPAGPVGPKLTAVSAMDVADIEARTRGHDLGEYQLPKAEYNSANDTWSVTYSPRQANGGAKKFSVIVQDKSGKAEVQK